MQQRLEDNMEQVRAYMCGLITNYGRKPTFEIAEGYTKRNHMLVSPQDVISTFGVEDWDGALIEYEKYLYGLRGKRRSKDIKKYSKQILLPILAELYQEFDGDITKKKLDRRRNNQPTPDWQTLIRHLGDKSTWDEQVTEYLKSTQS